MNPKPQASEEENQKYCGVEFGVGVKWWKVRIVFDWKSNNQYVPVWNDASQCSIQKFDVSLLATFEK